MKRKLDSSSAEPVADREKKRRLESKADEPAVETKRALPEAKDDSLELLSDTESALLLLKQQFPFTVIGMKRETTPLMLCSQIYSLIRDRTVVDQELDALKRALKIRILKLVSARDENAVVYSSDLIAKVQTLADELPSDAKSSDYRVLLQNVIDKVLNAHSDVSITRERLLSLVFAPSKFAVIKAEDALTFLVNCGLLLQRGSNVAGTTDTTSSFWFCVPDSGLLVRDIAQGRKEILQIIKRQKYKEIMLKELFTRKLRNTSRGMRFHVRDMVGAGVVTLTQTTLGELVQIPKTK